MGIISYENYGIGLWNQDCGSCHSDALRVTAQGIETITRKEENKLRRTCARIEELIGEYAGGADRAWISKAYE